ncbi:hypothetical protein B0H14DRAFT_2594416 [Mycena olivaceomarginata]|nr:hypothetical protein B0H14DRAFT_2594416 [Mycena olivaceomarginata]
MDVNARRGARTQYLLMVIATSVPNGTSTAGESNRADNEMQILMVEIRHYERTIYVASNLKGSGTVDARSETVPLLTADVDYGQLDSDEGSEDGNWTTVTKRTSRTHRERTVSQSNRDTNSSELTSTVEIATHDMSPENLLKLSHRYGQLAAAGFRARVES